MASHSALLYQFFEKNLFKILSLKTQGLNSKIVVTKLIMTQKFPNYNIDKVEKTVLYLLV